MGSRLSVGSYDQKGKVVINKSGGYELDMPWKSLKGRSLKVGAIKSSTFRGSLGPIGIFSKKDLKRDIMSVLSDFMRDPTTLSGRFNDENILLWSPDGTTDLSPLSHEMLLVDSEPKKISVEN